MPNTLTSLLRRLKRERLHVERRALGRATGRAPLATLGAG